MALKVETEMTDAIYKASPVLFAILDSKRTA